MVRWINVNIGILKEIKAGESRVVLTPSEVNELTIDGHSVLVESNAGLKAGFSNELYKVAGAQIENNAENIFKKSELVFKVKEISPEEYHLLQPNQIVYACLIPASNKEVVDVLIVIIEISISVVDTPKLCSHKSDV